MRTALCTIGAAVSALGVAAPASAQYFPQPPVYVYHPVPSYGPGYGYGYGHARALKARLDLMQREIRRLAQYRMISHGEYRDLIRNSVDIERRLIGNARDGRGLSPSEAYEVQHRLARLEYKVARDVRDGRRWRYRW